MVNTTDGVRLVVTTDVHCHIYCRLTLQPPRMHKKPSYRRGIWLNDDIRFCFTVFTDYEQSESGDTLIHTFWLGDWPYCTTKFFYFWGMQSTLVCESTSPIFEYHNDGVSPIPVPDKMLQLNSIDPQFWTLGLSAVWNTHDFSRDVPEDATGVILQIRNLNAGNDCWVGFRKPGCTYEVVTDMQRSGTLWLLVGLDSDHKIEYKFEGAGSLGLYLMGYTGRDVVFPDTPIDIKPAVDNVYSTIDIHTEWPDAKLILTDLGSLQAWNNYHSIRPAGSVKELYGGSFHCFPFCAVSAGGQIETKIYNRSGVSTKWLAYAYITKDCTTSIDGIDLTGFTANDWKTLNVGTLSTSIRWAFLEYKHPYSTSLVSARKQFSYYDYTGFNNNHGYMIVHVNHDRQCQVKSGNTTAADELRQIAESH